MYLLFRYHNVMPSIFQKMGPGERQILKNFMYYEIEEKIKEAKEVSRSI